MNIPRHSLSTPRYPMMVTPICPLYAAEILPIPSKTLYNQSSNLYMPCYSLIHVSPEVYSVYPYYPLKYPKKPMSALTITLTFLDGLYTHLLPLVAWIWVWVWTFLKRRFTRRWNFVFVITLKAIKHTCFSLFKQHVAKYLQ